MKMLSDEDHFVKGPAAVEAASAKAEHLDFDGDAAGQGSGKEAGAQGEAEVEVDDALEIFTETTWDAAEVKDGAVYAVLGCLVVQESDSFVCMRVTCCVCVCGGWW